MEKSRAIELLKLAVPIKALTQQEYADFVEAVNMGMDALEQPTSPVATDTNVGDTISRQQMIDALHTRFRDGFNEDKWWNSTHVLAAIEGMPPALPEPAIPLSWIDEQIERLKDMDNAFATLTALQISGMVKKWRGEQDG